MGVPLRTPLCVSKVTPAGSAPVSLNVGAGKPVIVTAKVEDTSTGNTVLLALVMAGASFTVKAKDCVASEPIPLLAVKVMG